MATDCIDRGNKLSHSGYVRWPTHFSVADAGCSVVAVVMEGEFGRDPFVRTLDGVNVTLRYANPHVSEELRKALWPGIGDPGDGAERYTSTEVLAAVTLGTCGAALWDKARGDVWCCERSDLTPDGEALVAALERLYGRSAVLVTFIQVLSVDGARIPRASARGGSALADDVPARLCHATRLRRGAA